MTNFGRGGLVGCCARMAHSDGGQEAPGRGVRLRTRDSRDRLQQMLNRMERRQVDRKPPLPKLLMALDVFDRRRDETFDSVRLLSLRTFQSVKAVNKPSIGRNNIPVRDHIAKLTVNAEHADEKIVL